MPLVSRDEAWSRIEALVEPLGSEDVALKKSLGRTLAAAALARIDLPPFDRSAMDGYAVRSQDTASATAGEPVRLALASGVESAAGGAGDVPVEPGHAQRIFTGGPLPPGADAVERQEVVTLADHDTAAILREPVRQGKNVRYRGEDTRKGAVLVPVGTQVRAAHMPLLASAGIDTVEVHERARVAILMTGDELVAPGQPLGPGQIYESNGQTLRALVKGAGAKVLDLGVAPDRRDEITDRIANALSFADVLLVAGGMSVGDHDHVRPALERLGVEELFWGVRVKPGKPLYCGRPSEDSRCRWVFGLPGNPLSAVVGFLLFAGPTLQRMHGLSGPAPRYLRARIAVDVGPEDGRTTLLTATLGTDAAGDPVATPTEQQGSAMTAALAGADAFVVVPDGTPRVTAGTWVDVLLAP